MRKARLNDFLGDYRDPKPRLSRAEGAELVAKCIRGCDYLEDTADLCGILEGDLTLAQKIAEVAGMVDRLIYWSGYAALEDGNSYNYTNSQVSQDLHALGQAFMAQLLKHVDTERSI